MLITYAYAEMYTWTSIWSFTQGNKILLLKGILPIFSQTLMILHLNDGCLKLAHPLDKATYNIIIDIHTQACKYVIITWVIWNVLIIV